MMKGLVALLLFLLPTWLVAPLLRFAGYQIGANVRIGFSLVFVDRRALANGARIGHGNLIRIRRLILYEAANINRSNIFDGPLSVLLASNASLGNRNKVMRAPSPTVVGWGAALVLNEGARITSDHLIDCTRSVYLGAHSILAGSGSQLWTHGYIHALSGPGRYRIDGCIDIGNNVYLGSRCIVNLGVSIAPGCTIGAGAVVSKALKRSAFYVAAALRDLPLVDEPDTRFILKKESSPKLCESVYYKELVFRNGIQLPNNNNNN